MDITIGIQNTARELNLELEGTKEEITKDLKKQLSGELLELTDARGNLVILPTQTIAFVQLNAEAGRKVGFGPI